MKSKNLASQFQGLKMDDPGSWPIAPKLVCLVACLVGVVVGGYFIDTKPQLDLLANGQQKEKGLKDEYVGKYGSAMNLELYKKQLVEVDQSFGTLLKQLPDRSKMESLITDINQSGVSRGLSFDLFKPAAAEVRKEFYAELPISVKVQGNYHQMGQFAADISKLPRIVTLNDISVSVTKDGGLQMEAVAKTFRYLDEEELAAQRKAEADKKAKANKGGPKKPAAAPGK